MFRQAYKFTKIFCLLVIIMCIVVPAQAQEDAEEPLKFGQTVSGEITNRQFEVAYRFSAQEGDYIFINYEFDEPAIIILYEDYEQWRSYEYDYGDKMFLVDKIPADGDYIIIVSRSGGRAGVPGGRDRG